MEVRQCFVPRPGYVFIQGDYPSLELHTLGQACLDLVGYSTLATSINAGIDPHTALAAKILGMSYEQGAKLKKSKDKDFDMARQTAKVANFGLPGGLGVEKFVFFAKKSYKVVLTPERAKELKQQWLAQWPEMKEYFAFIRKLVDNPKKLATLRHLRSNRWRSGATYTAAANSFFQGLGADAACHALWLVQKECYAVPTSPLFGTRCVNFVHDEIIAESPVDVAPEAAVRLGQVMADGANPWLPGCPFEPIETLLMTRWSKSAEPLKDANGRLTPWSPKLSLSA